MKSIKLLLFSGLIILSFSCKKDNDYSVGDEMCGVLTREFADANTLLTNNIAEKIKNIPIYLKPQVQAYDSITAAYINYLSETEKSIESNNHNPFFQGDKITPQGVEYLSKTKTYYSNISKFSADKNLSERMKRFVSIQDYHTEDDNYLIHSEYYLKGFDPIHLKAYINNKKLFVLQIENELIDVMIIANLKR